MVYEPLLTFPSQNSEPVQLKLGQPQAGHVGQQSYSQYQISLPGGDLGGDDLQVLVNPTMGDADLYITLDGSRPVSTNFQFRSATWGDTQVGDAASILLTTERSTMGL